MRQIRLAASDSHKSLLERLREREIFLPADCGGAGTCGKCRVRFLKRAPEPKPVERRIFTQQQLEDGWRLACMACPEEEVAIEFEPRGDAIDVLAEFAVTSEAGGVPASGQVRAETQEPQIIRKVAVDLGTTTIAAALVDCTNDKILATQTGVNHQRSLGCDVITRIRAAAEGKAQELQRTVDQDLADLIRQLGEDPDTVETVIAGNTTMEHLLLGLPCESLGRAPYTPVDISLHRAGNRLIMPGISTFVGADIVSGIVACGMDQSEKTVALIDLGTNGEMAVGNRSRILVASAAAGPAFEGGCISCGTAGIRGAIDAVEIRNGSARVHTIGSAKPVGICGSGVIETVYELCRTGIVDETGQMDEKYEQSGFPLALDVFFTGEDIREVQLAKSAVRAGFETLAQEYGIDIEQIDTLYLAGGFGWRINLKKAVGIGLLPRIAAERIRPVGNSSLAGAVMLAEDAGMAKRLEWCVKISREVGLAGNTTFNELYMDHMYFDPDDLYAYDA